MDRKQHVPIIRAYIVNTGSCGGCDIEIDTAMMIDTTLTRAHTPQDADVLLFTGPLTPANKAAFSSLLQDVPDTPILTIGRCAIDGHPFGKGGVQELEAMLVQLRLRLDGCPPQPETIAETIQKHIR